MLLNEAACRGLRRLLQKIAVLLVRPKCRPTKIAVLLVRPQVPAHEIHGSTRLNVRSVPAIRLRRRDAQRDGKGS